MRRIVMLTVALATASLVHAQSGEELYNKNCKKCHGDDGKAHTMVGRMTKAADLTSDAVAKSSDAELTMVISHGRGKMSGFGEKLGGDAGVADVLKYVRLLKK